MSYVLCHINTRSNNLWITHLKLTYLNIEYIHTRRDILTKFSKTNSLKCFIFINKAIFTGNKQKKIIPHKTESPNPIF